MPNIEAAGIVLREVKYGENSRILTVLAKDIGKISVLAGRSRSNRSGMLVATQLFSYSNFTLFKGRENSLLKLNEAEVVSAFGDIRLSLDKIAYASYFCDIANHICADGAEENELLRLLLNIMFKLSKTAKAEEYLKLEAVFLLRAAACAGLAPSCGGCAACGSETNIKTFSLSDGVFRCADCSDKSGVCMEINDALYKAVCFIESAEDRHMFSFSMGVKALEYLVSVAEEYMRVQLERDFKTLDYLRNVRTL